jgi:ornithine cyclodeaminase/alanine dehydrogenase-like protein (mu-crystallin family)
VLTVSISILARMFVWLASSVPKLRELAEDVVEGASILAVDTRSGCLAEAEDLRVRLETGLIGADAVAEIGRS